MCALWRTPSLTSSAGSCFRAEERGGGGVACSQAQIHTLRPLLLSSPLSPNQTTSLLKCNMFSRMTNLHWIPCPATSYHAFANCCSCRRGSKLPFMRRPGDVLVAFFQLTINILHSVYTLHTSSNFLQLPPTFLLALPLSL